MARGIMLNLPRENWEKHLENSLVSRKTKELLARVLGAHFRQDLPILATDEEVAELWKNLFFVELEKYLGSENFWSSRLPALRINGSLFYFPNLKGSEGRLSILRMIHHHEAHPDEDPKGFKFDGTSRYGQYTCCRCKDSFWRFEDDPFYPDPEHESGWGEGGS